MRFSIIVPIYNVEAYLSACVESLLGQTYSDFEVVLVDDGSTDGSPAICDRFAEQDARIRVIHKPNGGLVSARKAGAQAVRGDYVINVDGDDMVESDYLEMVSKAIDDSDNADMILWNLTELYDDHQVVPKTKLPQGLYCGEALERIKGLYLYDKEEERIRMDTLIPGWTKAVRRELYCACQAEAHEAMTKGEDAFVMLLMLIQCRSLYILHYNGYYYRVVESSMIRKISEKDFDAVALLLRSMRERLTEWPAFERQLQLYSLFMFEHVLILAARAFPYRRYRDIIRRWLDEDLLEFTAKGVIAKPSRNDRIMKWAVTRKHWWLLYRLVRLKG